MDWNLIGGALGLKSGTASMRWQRLKPRLDKMDFDSVPASNVIDEHTMFLYQCIIYGDVKVCSSVHALGGLSRFRACASHWEDARPSAAGGFE